MLRYNNNPRYKPLIRAIGDCPGIRQLALSRKLGIDHSTVFYRIRELERSGIVRIEREPSVVKLYLVEPQASPAGDL